MRASRGAVVLDFLTSPIEADVLDIHLDLDHAVVKLLVADGTCIDDDDLRRAGRCRVKDWTAKAPQVVGGSTSAASCATPRFAYIAGASRSCRCCSVADPCAQSGNPP